jgi:hypothetical protein
LKEEAVAKKTMLVSDLTGATIEDGKGATLRVTYHDARKGAREMDLTAEEADRLLDGKARAVARRGRRPKAATTG